MYIICVTVSVLYHALWLHVYAVWHNMCCDIAFVFIVLLRCVLLTFVWLFAVVLLVLAWVLLDFVFVFLVHVLSVPFSACVLACVIACVLASVVTIAIMSSLCLPQSEPLC